MKILQAISHLQDTGCYRTLLSKDKIHVGMKVSGRICMTLESVGGEIDDHAVAYLIGEATYLKTIHSNKENFSGQRII